MLKGGGGDEEEEEAMEEEEGEEEGVEEERSGEIEEQESQGEQSGRLFGLSFKTTPMSVVQLMITAIIDANGWFGPGVSCADSEEAKRFPLAFADFVKKAKVVAGIFLVLLLLI